MKLGILQCDSVVDEYQPTFGNYPNMFIQLFTQCDPTIETATYNVELGEYPTTDDECDAYITTGSKASVYEDLPWLTDFKAFIQRLYTKKIKLIGICFGHQLIADVFGGKTDKSNKGWGVGVSSNEVLSHQPWMEPPLQTLHIIVSHQDQVTQLPDIAKLLITSDFCTNYCYQIGKTIVSIQGHPEFSKDYAETLMRHRGKKLGNRILQQGLSSLSLETHDQIFAQWLINFISGKN